MDARQQFRRIALAAQDRDLTSVAFAVEGEVAQPTIRMHNTAGLARARNAAAILCFPHNGDSETLPASAPGKDNHDKLPPIGSAPRSPPACADSLPWPATLPIVVT